MPEVYGSWSTVYDRFRAWARQGVCPDGLRAATAEELLDTAKPLAARMAGRLVEAVKTALDAQTVVVPGATAASTVLPYSSPATEKYPAIATRATTEHTPPAHATNRRAAPDFFPEPQSSLSQTVQRTPFRQDHNRICAAADGPQEAVPSLLPVAAREDNGQPTI